MAALALAAAQRSGRRLRHMAHKQSAPSRRATHPFPHHKVLLGPHPQDSSQALYSCPAALPATPLPHGQVAFKPRCTSSDPSTLSIVARPLRSHRAPQHLLILMQDRPTDCLPAPPCGQPVPWPQILSVFLPTHPKPASPIVPPAPSRWGEQPAGTRTTAVYFALRSRRPPLCVSGGSCNPAMCHH